jgi:flagellar biogenesis protein FliO
VTTPLASLAALALAAGEPVAAAPAATLPGALPSLATLAGPAALLLALAAAALLLSRRRRAPTRRVQVLETTPLGPKRALVLARLGDEVLLLGASEAGITLLRTQPAGPASAPALAVAPPPARAAAPARDGAAAGLVDLAARLVPGRRRGDAAPASPAFDALLAESAEDQELRRKLQRGLAGSVR